MRTLFGVLALAASFVPTAGPPPQAQPQTIYLSPPHQTIGAFADDSGLFAWFAPGSSTTGCNTVWVLDLVTGATQHLPLQGAKYRNVTCRWQVPPGSPIGLALARGDGSGPSALWTLRESASAQSPVTFDYVLGATVSDPNERRFQEVAHGVHGAGLWLGGIAGDAGTLVYGVANVAYKDEVECLSTPKAPGACDMEIGGGGVYRVVGRRPPTLVKGTSAAVAVAASGTDVAFVPAATAAAGDGHPAASTDLPVQVRDVGSGALLASVTPDGAPLAIALSSTVLALLERTPAGTELGWYDPATGNPLGTLPVPAETAPLLAAGSSLVAFRVGRSIRVVDVTTRRARTVATAAAAPIGLAVDGNRVTWAENLGGRGRIRAVAAG
jgi:hypothetical protein